MEEKSPMAEPSMMRVRGTTMYHFIDHSAILGPDMSRLAPILRKITHVRIAKLTLDTCKPDGEVAHALDTPSVESLTSINTGIGRSTIVNDLEMATFALALTVLDQSGVGSAMMEAALEVGRPWIVMERWDWGGADGVRRLAKATGVGSEQCRASADSIVTEYRVLSTEA